MNVYVFYFCGRQQDKLVTIFHCLLTQLRNGLPQFIAYLSVTHKWVRN